jgi:adenine-specific DNA-methyltransferase
MLQNIINQTTEIKSVYDYNTQSTNELNVSQEEKTSIIQKQNQEFLNKYTQQFISENLSSSIFVANVTKTLASNFTISKLSTQAVEVVNNINSLSTSSEINNYATKVEENSFNEAKSILTTILNDLGKTEISQMIINSASSSEIKNVIHNNFNNLNSLEKNIAEKTLNESFYVSNRLNEAINIFNQDIKENSTNISNYVATQTLTNLIQNYVNSQINSGSLSVVDNIPKANINQAITLANALSVINKEDIINNLLSLNQNTFNNKQESSYRVVSFKFDQDFREAVSSIAASSSPETIATDVSIFKQEIFNSAISTVNEIMNQSNIKLDSYDTIVQNQTISVDEKIQDILKTFNTTLSNQSLFEENKNLENIKNYVLNESYKIELLNKISSQDLLVNNKFDEFENEITTKIQQYLISSSFVKNVNNFRTEISQKNSIEEVKQYSSEKKIIILNDVKSFVSDFISVVKPEYLNTENLNTINDATSIEQISNIFAENNNQFTSSENSTVSNIINQNEKYYLLAILIDAVDHVANMSGTYGAYLKIWRSVALKRLLLKKRQIINNNKFNTVYQRPAEELIKSISGDVLYLDPPYNSRQYAPNFHVLESLAVWDKQALVGKTGLRDYSNQKSSFSSKRSAPKALRSIIEDAQFPLIALSYNNEGIISHSEIEDILSRFGKVNVFTTDYRRFRTERDHESRKYKEVDDRTKEYLFVLRK